MLKNKIPTLLFLLFVVCLKAQSFKQINDFSYYIGRDFVSFEKGLKLKPSGKTVKFGLKSRTYDFPGFFISVSELEEGKIGEIYYFIEEEKEKSEKWYNLVSQFNRDDKYIFQRSYIADPKDKITDDSLDYRTLIDVLRSSSDTDNYIFEIVYKKGNVYTRVSCSPVSVNVISSIKEFK